MMEAQEFAQKLMDDGWKPVDGHPDCFVKDFNMPRHSYLRFFLRIETSKSACYRYQTINVRIRSLAPIEFDGSGKQPGIIERFFGRVPGSYSQFHYLMGYLLEEYR